MKKTVSQKIYDGWTNTVSGVLGLFSPRSAIKYLAGRNHYRAFSAASKTGPEGYWRPRSRSGDAELKTGFQLILSRCRELAQNNPFIKGAIRKIVNNTVRNGIHLQMNLKKRNGEIDKTRNDAIEAEWKRWQRKEVIDVTGHSSLAMIQALVLRHLWVDGEVLVLRTINPNPDPGELPLQIEVLECDQLDSSIDGVLPNGNVCKRGIELDAQTGRPLYYHITKDHPGDYQYRGRYETVKIPAADIIHVFEKERASQTRGVSWMVAIAMEAYSFADYQHYERIGAKLAAAFGVFVKSQYPETFQGNTNSLGGKPVNYTGSTTDDDLPDFIDPGRIQKLPVGTDITIASHNRPGDSYEPYVRTSLRGQSAGTGISYEAYSNDYSTATFSSARSGSLEERLSYKGMQFLLNEQLNSGLANWFLEALSFAKPALVPGYARMPYKYQSAVTWQVPGWGWIDPLKDANAAGKEVEMCINNRRNQAAQRGIDWDANMDQLEREEDRLLVLAKKRAERLKLLAAFKGIENELAA